MKRKSKYRMFKFTELETVHLEITNNCQASCPMCARNYHGGQDNPLIKVTGWTLDEFKTIFTQEVMSQLKGVYFCGNFGDPILNNDLIPMVRYLAEHAPDMVVNIHTNGGARKTEWWEELAGAMPKYHNVCFGIDGLEDTHHIYRIGTTYDNVIKNAKAFIDAGGRAEWAFIKFKHNEHQEQQARDRAASLGFYQFTLKNSSRFLGEPRYRVIDKEGNVTHYIEPPSDNKMHFISKEMIERYKETVMPLEVSCKVQKSKEIYIDTYKNIMPCCWIGSIPYTQYDYDNVNAHIRSEIKRQYNELSQDMGNTNAYEVGIKGVIDSDSWQNKWKTYWTTKKMIMCARICGQNSTFSNPDDQFLERAKINQN